MKGCDVISVFLSLMACWVTLVACHQYTSGEDTALAHLIAFLTWHKARCAAACLVFLAATLESFDVLRVVMGKRPVIPNWIAFALLVLSAVCLMAGFKVFGWQGAGFYRLVASVTPWANRDVTLALMMLGGFLMIPANLAVVISNVKQLAKG
jgi:hypothetical protein